MSDFHGYRLESFDPWQYFKGGARWSLQDLIAGGLNGYSHRRALSLGAAGVDRLYRDRDRAYMRMVSDFVDKFRDYDLIVMSTFNFLHPEILIRQLKKPIKVLGFIDDPHSTYQRGIPYLWAFDGAFHISPSYIDEMPFSEAIQRWTDKPTIWWPLVPMKLDRPKHDDERFFRERDVDLVYIGNPTGSKVDRLISLKHRFGARIRIHGRWRFGGYFGLLRGLLGKPVYPHRVTGVTHQQRTELYWRTKIGFNMHVSPERHESGNARMYELPAHGVLMVCDKGAADAHARVFAPDEEAVYYDCMDDAIERIDYYLRNEEERVRIAKRGFERYWREYTWEDNLLRFLNWAMSIRSESGPVAAAGGK